MDQIRYIVQQRGNDYTVFCEYRYDSGHNRLVEIESFKMKSAAESFAEFLNEGGDSNGC